MPKPIEWTAEQDHTIVTMRARGAFWDRIAAACGVHRQTAIARGRELGAELPEEASEADDEREPLPPGSGVSWDAINAGTCNQGAEYPHPVFS